MKTKDVIISLIIIILSYSIAYLFGAILSWEFDLAEWTAQIRNEWLSFASASAVIGLILYFMLKNKTHGT